MAAYTIIGSDGKQYGSVSEEQLRQWIADGRVNAQTQAQLEGAGEWKSLSKFPEFAGVLKCSAPPPLPASTLAVPAKTSALAITSLVLGIFLVMIPIYAAMLLPALAAAKQKAQTINCVNNEKQLALAVKIYSSGNAHHFPPAATWCDAIKTDVGSEKVFKCVAANSSSRCDYAFNVKLDGLDESKIAPNTVMIFESDGGWNANGGPELMIGKPRHARVFVVAFADSSVQQLRESQINTLRWDP